MAQYINKDAIVAEIARLQATTMDEDSNFYTAKAQAEYNVLCMLDSFLDTLEVKEVDLEQEIQQHINDCLNIKFPTTDIKMIAKDVEYTARKFFELGLKAQKGEEI